ncbi:serine hydrolase, partial [Clostridium perfringens]
LKDGELSITVPMIPDYPAEKYVYTADGTFVSADGSTKVSFVKEKNDRIYLWVRQYVTIPGLGQMALSHYTAEKMEANPLSKETAAAWAKREGETFYPLNEKFTSLMYFITKPTVEISSKSGLEGYMIDK